MSNTKRLMEDWADVSPATSEELDEVREDDHSQYDSSNKIGDVVTNTNFQAAIKTDITVGIGRSKYNPFTEMEKDRFGTPEEREDTWQAHWTKSPAYRVIRTPDSMFEGVEYNPKLMGFYKAIADFDIIH